MLDPNLGMTYLRARWMDNSTGRLTARDPFEGLEIDLASLHRYGYAKDDPVNKIDPGGEFAFLIVALAAVSIVAIAGTSAGAGTGTTSAQLGSGDVDRWVRKGVESVLFDLQDKVRYSSHKFEANLARWPLATRAIR
ncbi:MAG: hypothetical protein IPK07_30580 [Deltaproteobacteria bacterium]|nr:hypothetical protein [Deltaproteobacteria bacterium]